MHEAAIPITACAKPCSTTCMGLSTGSADTWRCTRRRGRAGCGAGPPPATRPARRTTRPRPRRTAACCAPARPHTRARVAAVQGPRCRSHAPPLRCGWPFSGLCHVMHSRMFNLIARLGWCAMLISGSYERVWVCTSGRVGMHPTFFQSWGCMRLQAHQDCCHPTLPYHVRPRPSLLPPAAASPPPAAAPHTQRCKLQVS